MLKIYELEIKARLPNFVINRIRLRLIVYHGVHGIIIKNSKYSEGVGLCSCLETVKKITLCCKRNLRIAIFKFSTGISDSVVVFLIKKKIKIKSIT